MNCGRRWRSGELEAAAEGRQRREEKGRDGSGGRSALLLGRGRSNGRSTRVPSALTCQPQDPACLFFFDSPVEKPLGATV